MKWFVLRLVFLLDFCCVFLLSVDIFFFISSSTQRSSSFGGFSFSLCFFFLDWAAPFESGELLINQTVWNVGCVFFIIIILAEVWCVCLCKVSLYKLAIFFLPPFVRPLGLKESPEGLPPCVNLFLSWEIIFYLKRRALKTEEEEEEEESVWYWPQGSFLFHFFFYLCVAVCVSHLFIPLFFSFSSSSSSSSSILSLRVRPDPSLP